MIGVHRRQALGSAQNGFWSANNFVLRQSVLRLASISVMRLTYPVRTITLEHLFWDLSRVFLSGFACSRPFCLQRCSWPWSCKGSPPCFRGRCCIVKAGCISRLMCEDLCTGDGFDYVGMQHWRLVKLEVLRNRLHNLTTSHLWKQCVF